MIRLFRHYIPIYFLAIGLVEFFILLLAVYLGVWARYFGVEDGIDAVTPLWPKALVFAGVMLSSMIVLGLYQRNFRQGVWGIAVRIGLSFCAGLILMILVFYTFPALFLGRGSFALVFLLAAAGVIASRYVVFELLDNDALKRRILVLGAGRRAAQIEANLRRKTDRRGLLIVGYVHVQHEVDMLPKDLVIRRDTTLLDLTGQLNVDSIVVAVEDRRAGFPLHEILDCRMSGIEVLDILTFFEQQSGKIPLDLLHPSWLIFSDGFRYGAFRVFSKRMFDIIVSVSLLCLIWPVMAITALAIIIEGKGSGPVLYRQRRLGENWGPFEVLKFRSMQVDAEIDGAPVWADKNDDRVTRVGAFIRKTRIDELPQIFNVLKGEMSFVGPRPERPGFVEELAAKIPFYPERSRVKPGITGWAQVCFPYTASEEGAVQKLQYDLYYVKNYSIFLDLMILALTAEVVLFGKGAR